MFYEKIRSSVYLLPHLYPKTIREHSVNHMSWLTGIEKWLSFRLGFEVEIFTIIQKKYLNIQREQTLTRIGDCHVCDPVIFGKMLEALELNI